MYHLGFAAFEVGNPPEGQVWFERASRLSGDQAVDAALSLTVEAAKAGDADAQTRLGVQFARSGGTTAADGFLRQAADQGHVHALWWLAVLHGPATPDGFDWLSKAHAARHPQAVAFIRAFRESGWAEG